MPDDSNSVNTGVGAMAPDASTSPVDWSRPIEAVHEDGRVVPAQRLRHDADNTWPDENGQFHVCSNAGMFWESNGKPWRADRGYRIRNVQPTTPELDPALWDRMVALVRWMADRYDNGRSDDESVARDAYPWMRDARAIVGDLPKPVDPDLIEARKLAAEVEDFPHGSLEDLALAAIKRGRQLAGEQA